MRQVMAAALMGTMAGALIAPAAVHAQGQAELAVTGTGEIQVVPDMATVTLGVEEQGMTAEEAMTAASDKIAAVLAVVAEAGVAPEDVQTAGLTLNPVYETPRDDVNRPPRILGFEAGSTLRVTVRDLDGLGGILDSVVREGANTFRGLDFALQDPAMAHDDARREAVTDALAKAAVIAEAAGGSRGAILSIREEGAGAVRPEYSARMVMSDGAMPVAPGSLNVTERVTIIFALGE
ncbi:SIMPL domain-containing protein [Mangrovicoccus algicola]|uniref:SIMPL domain-containing protein n=1 Tax=Mangrovicoccus algicola TaxID=2771008 RepID=A0A8J7CKS0_9RHOB|nr:SIMPL domain-containing protein [Mangrovicoccus algicola]MBE3639181.1 SIMPL domain-containing protein [Mangrovicoccus algicola]